MAQPPPRWGMAERFISLEAHSSAARLKPRAGIHPGGRRAICQQMDLSSPKHSNLA